ncbi:hypothetical protein RJ640_004787 [Escallonia rubra]|uniref:Protein ENHANCED DOWNY MILDEW 2 n=1 Tax=Escallonia rubra TaxID=112253 RepID=A0AA88UM08_9ASTE|nr:hypothetical protein RJ640_004787 [Escallonia rubra]
MLFWQATLEKSGFIVDDDLIDEAEEDELEDELDEEGEEIESDDDDDLFETVCSICDEGGELLSCEGSCFRSFHPTKMAGASSRCKTLGFTAEEVDVCHLIMLSFACVYLVWVLFLILCVFCRHYQTFFVRIVNISNTSASVVDYWGLLTSLPVLRYEFCFPPWLESAALLGFPHLGSLGKRIRLALAKGSKYSLRVFRCVSATCGRFYHPRCVAKLLLRGSENEVDELQEKIAAGEDFTCPVHKCIVCKQGEDKTDHGLQFAICRRCPKAYHRKCLPRKIAFEDLEDEGIIQRAWDNLFKKTKRILIYCLKHEIVDGIGTPIRNHIKFPIDGQKKRRASELLPSREKVASQAKSPASEDASRKITVMKPPKGAEKWSNIKQGDSSKKREGGLSGPQLKKQKVVDTSQKHSNNSSATKVSKRTMDGGKASLAERSHALVKSSEADMTDNGHEQTQTVTSVAEETSSLSLDVDSQRRSHSYLRHIFVSCFIIFLAKKLNEIYGSCGLSFEDGAVCRILALMKEAASSITQDDIAKMHKVPSTHASSSRNTVDKTITMGKALRAALHKLEEGCSVEDAKAVCEPGVLSQIMKWKSKLRVYLAPFLHGMRYTSFGRHFTKVEHLKAVSYLVATIVRGFVFLVRAECAWVCVSGACSVCVAPHFCCSFKQVVDFCCGSNDFSCLMKKRLDEMGKKCSYKNFDIVYPKHDFNFEKRDWMSVRKEDFPAGKELIMGLNPPFGVNASLANQFINKALEFRPKLLILILPLATERLDKKKPAYDLIWEDDMLLSGRPFYFPGSVDVNGEQIDQWNVCPTPLYLWSRPDWTDKHKAIAQEHGHLSRVREETHAVDNSHEANVPVLHKEDPEVHGAVSMLLDYILQNEEPVAQERATSTGASQKEGFSRDNGRREGVKNVIHEEGLMDDIHWEDQSTKNPKKRNRGKKKRGRGLDGKLPEEKQKGRSPLPWHSQRENALDEKLPRHSQLGTGSGEKLPRHSQRRNASDEKLAEDKQKGRNSLRGKSSDEKFLEDKQNVRSPVHHHSPPHMSRGRSVDGHLPKHMGVGKEGYQHMEPTMSESLSQFRTGHSGIQDDDLQRTYSSNSEDWYARSTYLRSSRASLGSDYGARDSDENFSGYLREGIDSRGYRPYAEQMDERYGSQPDVRSRIPFFGQQDPGTFSQRSSYSMGTDPGFSTPYGHLGPASDSVYSRTSTSTMQRYAPRLDELNHTRMNSLGSAPPPVPVNRNGVFDYNLHVPSPGFRADSLGFAPGPYRPPSHQNSSGWLND